MLSAYSKLAPHLQAIVAETIIPNPTLWTSDGKTRLFSSTDTMRFCTYAMLNTLAPTNTGFFGLQSS
jgi:hypothetical protein